MRPADLSLTVSQRKLACVLDPALVLGHGLGPALALRLARVFEAWLTRSFWQVIDASELLMHRPPEGVAGPDPQALAAWIAMRDGTDAGSWTLRWVGDSLAESQLQQADGDVDLVDRYESLLAALLERVPEDGVRGGWAGGLDPVLAALDTAALSASLDGALVLGLASPEPGRPPPPVQALQRAGVTVRSLEPMPAHTLFATERAWVREALVGAGLATMAERLPPLAVLHVAAGAPASIEGDGPGDPWAGAEAWWYLV